MAIPADKAKKIRDVQSKILGRDILAHIWGNKCVRCLGPATEFKDEDARREFTISGLCQTCQDTAFAPLGEDED